MTTSKQLKRTAITARKALVGSVTRIRNVNMSMPMPASWTAQRVETLNNPDVDYGSETSWSYSIIASQ